MQEKYCLNPVYTIQPVVKPVVQPVWQPVGCLFTRYSRWFDNRYDNRVERTAAVHTTGCQAALYNRFDNWLYTR